MREGEHIALLGANGSRQVDAAQAAGRPLHADRRHAPRLRRRRSRTSQRRRRRGAPLPPPRRPGVPGPGCAALLANRRRRRGLRPAAARPAAAEVRRARGGGADGRWASSTCATARRSSSLAARRSAPRSPPCCRWSRTSSCFDEPTASLDPRTKWVLVNLIQELGDAGHRRLITATHELEIVPIIAERVIVIGEDRRVLADGPRSADPGATRRC